MPNVGDCVTLKRLKAYEAQGWRVLVDVFHVNHWLELGKVNPVWLTAERYAIISIHERTIYAVPLDRE